MYCCPKCGTEITNTETRESFPFPEESEKRTKGVCSKCGWEGDVDYDSSSDFSRILHNDDLRRQGIIKD